MTRRPPGPHCDVDLLHWSRYLDGEFSSAKCRECDAHLATCAACRKTLRDVKATVRTLKAMARQPLPASVKIAIGRRAKAIAKA